MVSIASDDIEKLHELIDHLDSLPQNFLDRILSHLSSEVISSKPENERLELWTGLAKFASKHKRFSDAKRILNSEIFSKLDSIVAQLAPTDPSKLYRRLFSNNEFALYEEYGNWEEKRQRLEKRRQEAIKDILAYSGMNGIIQFAEVVESPSYVGYSLGAIAHSENDIIILPKQLGTENKKLAQFVSGYIGNCLNVRGWAWVDGLDKSKWSASQIGQLLSYLPFSDETWNRASVWLDNSEEEYWLRASANPYQAHGDLGVAIDKLIDFGKPRAAIGCLFKTCNDKQPLDKSRSVKALLAARSSNEPSYTIDDYQIIELIKALQNDRSTEPEELFQVEWAYLPLLNRHHDSYPKFLGKRLASVPAFFCDVIRLIYRSRKQDKSQKESSEEEKAIATNAWRLLHEWRTPPGMQAHGVFSKEQFAAWLEAVKAVCTESGHIEVALTHVGQVLIYSPSDPQGLWIDQTVADALNARDAEEMRNGFRMGLLNSRGVYWVDPTGKPESELAEQFSQKADEIENAGYHRLAVTLRSIAEDYSREAGHIVAKQSLLE